jgi:hypothetical protein
MEGTCSPRASVLEIEYQIANSRSTALEFFSTDPRMIDITDLAASVSSGSDDTGMLLLERNRPDFCLVLKSCIH